MVDLPQGEAAKWALVRLLRPGTRKAGHPVQDDSNQGLTARLNSELSRLRSLESGPGVVGEEEARAAAVRESLVRLVQLVRAKYKRPGKETPVGTGDSEVRAEAKERRMLRWRSTVGKAAVFGLLLVANVVFWLVIAPALGVGAGP